MLGGGIGKRDYRFVPSVSSRVNLDQGSIMQELLSLQLSLGLANTPNMAQTFTKGNFLGVIWEYILYNTITLSIQISSGQLTIFVNTIIYVS
jgi:hypothetical protein